MPAYDFSGKVALVTGGSRGIGRSHAEAYAEHGADVAVLDLPGADTEDVLEAVEAAGSAGLALEGDVRSESDVGAAVESAVEELGRIDILANNAGISDLAELTELDEADWDRMIDIHAKGMWLCAKHVANHMVERGEGGKIVNTSSTFGHVGCPGFGHYAVAKFGIRGLTQTLAMELAEHRINVNAVSPTGVATPGGDELGESYAVERFEEMAGFTGHWNLFDPPIERIEPRHVTEAFLWLSSDASDMVSGISLPVNAGMAV